MTYIGRTMQQKRFLTSFTLTSNLLLCMCIKGPYFLFLSKTAKIESWVSRVKSGHIFYQAFPWTGCWNPLAVVYLPAVCFLSWCLQSPCRRAVLGTSTFSGLSLAQKLPVCEDARTPPVLPITWHLKVLAFCLGSCKELAQLRFSHILKQCRDNFFFIIISFFIIQSTRASVNSWIKALRISVEIDFRVSAVCGNLVFTHVDFSWLIVSWDITVLFFPAIQRSLDYLWFFTLI